MVVFTCNHCGESLHKPKVEKHFQFQCRNYKSLTCVDCMKDFRDDEYVVHTKCITEDERYSAKGTYINGIVKKGDVKQESWLDMIKSICDAETNLRPSIRNMLETISEYSNVPRKKNKFMNFIKSSSGNRANMNEVEEVWDIIEKYKGKNKPNSQNGNQAQTQKDGIETKKRSHENGDNSESSKKKRILEEEVQAGEATLDEGTISKKEKKKKLKTEEALKTTNSESVDEPSKFDYKAKILEILTGKPSISHKKLQKKILKAYLNATGQSDCEEEKVVKKINKKLKNMPNVGIKDDRVQLIA